jgi:hypothetical protein
MGVGSGGGVGLGVASGVGSGVGVASGVGAGVTTGACALAAAAIPPADRLVPIRPTATMRVERRDRRRARADGPRRGRLRFAAIGYRVPVLTCCCALRSQPDVLIDVSSRRLMLRRRPVNFLADIDPPDLVPGGVLRPPLDFRFRGLKAHFRV